MNFAYTILDMANKDLRLVEEKLNEYGRQGWELVVVERQVYYLKRPLRVSRQAPEEER